MATPRDIRLSPSGPYILDGTSQQALQAGDGTPGLVWRSQGADPAADFVQFVAVLTEIVPLTMSFAPADGIPPGYHYDVDLNLWVDSNTGTLLHGVIHIAIEVEEATLPGVWTPVQNCTGDVLYDYILATDELAQDTTCIHCGNIDLDRTGSLLALTGVRVRVSAIATLPGDEPYYSTQMSNLRITQYVSE